VAWFIMRRYDKPALGPRYMITLSALSFAILTVVFLPTIISIGRNGWKIPIFDK